MLSRTTVLENIGKTLILDYEIGRAKFTSPRRCRLRDPGLMRYPLPDGRGSLLFNSDYDTGRAKFMGRCTANFAIQDKYVSFKGPRRQPRQYVEEPDRAQHSRHSWFRRRIRKLVRNAG